MDLKDLFVSYKEVKPVEIELNEPESLYTSLPIYLNFERAQQAAASSYSPQTSSKPSEDMSSWRVQSPKTHHWKVNTPGLSVTQDTAAAAPVTPGLGGLRQVGRWTSIYRDQRDRWIADMVAAYRSEGLSNNAIRNLIAKNALESGWGNYAQGAFNFGNITVGQTWDGMYVRGKDRDVAGNYTDSNFRAYTSLAEFVRDEINFLTRRFDFNPDDDIDTFAAKLQGNNRGHNQYAASPEYIKSLKGVYNGLHI